MPEDKKNRQLIYTYLKTIYSEKRSRELMHENRLNLFGFHGLAWSLGRRSLEFFSLYFLQDTFLPKPTNSAAPIADIHRSIWGDIQDSIIGDGPDQRGWILPRGTGKSAFGTFATTIWCHAYGVKKYTLICSDIGSTAEKFAKDIRITFLDNKYLDDAFGKLLDDKNKKYICNSTQLELTNGTFIEAISSASSMRGRKYGNNRPDLIILDDYQSDENVRSEEQRDKKWNRYSNDVKYASQKATYENGRVVKKGTTFVALGTLQHSSCFYSRLMKQPTWRFKNEKGVLLDDIETYFNTGLWLEYKKILFDFKNESNLEDAKEFYWDHIKEMSFPMLWPEFWDCMDIATQYFENPSAFRQEFMGDVNSIGEKWFKGVRTESRKDIETHSFTKTMLCADPASTANGKSDYSAFLVGSECDNGFKYVRKGELAKINARTDFDRYINYMVDAIKEYPEITHVYIEKNTFNGADANQLETKIKKDISLRHRSITIINEQQRKNKDDKISTIIPDINKGQVIFADEDAEFVDQILEFSGQKFSVHDDAPDITSEFVNRIVNVEANTRLQSLDIRKLF